MSLVRLVAPCLLITASASLAHADAADENAAEETASAHKAANDDSFTPALTHATGPTLASVTATATLDGAAHTNTADLFGEVQVWGPARLVLRVDNVFASSGGKARPGIGAAVQLLDERKHGVASSAYVSYKAEGFTEAEGEIEGLVSFGKQLGPVHGTLNLAYGQDPDGVERDGELAAGLHIEPIRGLFTGVVGRFRDALGSNGDKGTGILRDALGAATATYVIGRVGLTASAGIAGVKTIQSGTMQAGAEAAFSVGTVF
ncbi:MAG TPA: hypothetical protein VHW23_05565 [Kofleriaceae bacterium]|jgi:hypothetical protein|nr:hypothetical protein [Kofleriaceae bacterium]